MNYRSEIDGLRALAVVPVILFHAGFETFGGGYVGVDVFFVISGYLITTILLNDLDEDRFSLKRFYERRARRILPALFLVMLVCIPFAYMWLLPQDLKDFAQSLIAVTGFVSNFLFLSESGYFDTQTELKPLLHTWSLAVEEQYYLFFPLLLMFCWKWGKERLILILSLIAVASLLLAHFLVFKKPEAAFYILPTRFWELLVGSLAAFYLKYYRPLRRNQLIDQLGSLLGLALILYAVFAYSKLTPFPSFYALVPVIGTGLIILFANNGTLVFQLLGNRFLVGIGLLSYSAYLWHQPIFAFAKYRNIIEPSPIMMGALCAIVLPLSYLSWRFVEQPFRTKGAFNRKQIFTFAGTVSVFFIALGIIGDSAKGFKNRPQIANLKIEVGSIKTAICHNRGRRTVEQLKNGDICTLGEGPVHTALIGDSHASALSTDLGKAINLQGEALWVMSSGWCAPLADFHLNRYAKDCAERQRLAIENVIQNDTIKNVILYAEWSIYTEGYRDNEDPSLVTFKDKESDSLDNNPEVFALAYKHTVQLLKQAGKNVIVVGPTPEFPVHIIKTLKKTALFEQSFHNPALNIATYEKRHQDSIAILSNEDVTFIPAKPEFCNETVCLGLTKDGQPLFTDTNHLSEFGARRLVEKIQPALQ